MNRSSTGTINKEHTTAVGYRHYYACSGSFERDRPYESFIGGFMGDHFNDPAFAAKLQRTDERSAIKPQPITFKRNKMQTVSGRIIINTPASNRAIERIKALLPGATFYGSATLGSKRKSYIITQEVFEQHKDKLKELGATKARHQPFLQKSQKNSL